MYFFKTKIINSIKKVKLVLKTKFTSMKKNHYYLFLALTLAFFHVTNVSAQTVLKGKIKDFTGRPAEGASILIKETDQFVAANRDGAFEINAKQSPPFTLIISYVGYSAQSLNIESISDSPLEINFTESNQSNEVVITSRRRKEAAQQVPIPISIIGGAQIDDLGAFNVNRLKELVPTVQLYSSNPRNTTLNIRGLGSTFGLTNDGIDPGVGFYVDGVYYARPAATTLDFIDIDQIEVLRGPQGTLFGKNTTAGAFNITTRAPTFGPGANAELSFGNYGFIQAKASVTGGLGENFAGRISFSGTQRDGLIENIASNRMINDLNNQGVRAQLLYRASDKINLTLIADASSQRPDGYAQVVAGVVTTQRPAYRQFNNIIADLNYSLPSENAFDRIIDHNTPWRSNNDLGGISLNVDAKIGKGTLTSTTAYRYWNWGPSNDRDFTGLSVLQLSQAPSKHTQWSQEIRYAGDISKKMNGVFGVFVLGQNLVTNPYHTEESGDAQWRFSQNTTNTTAWSTPGLLDGYGIRTTSELDMFSGAVFGQLDYAITDKLHILPGIRWNYDSKDVVYDRVTYGGLQTTDPVLLAIKRSVYSDQSFDVQVSEQNFSGLLTLAYSATENINGFVTYSTSFKPVGVNLGGLPSAGGNPILELARIEPEFVKHFEVGIKTMPTKNAILNLVFHNTNIENFQTQVQTPEVGVNRGYLANAEEVRVWGVELDGSIRIKKSISLNGALAYTDGRYVSFENAPVPLEEVGGRNAFKDISGEVLPGISKWAGSVGGEITSKKSKAFAGQSGKYFVGADAFFRSSFSSSPSPSQFLNVDGYTLINTRAGFRASHGFSAFLWARNLFNVNYFEQLLPAAGSAGHFAGVMGDQRTFGVTLRYSL
jgi:iron complex outermembrane recepter protein